MKKIGYVIVRENLTDPLVQSQCIDIVESVNDSWPEGKLQIIWFFRLDYLFRKNATKLSVIKRGLYEKNVHVCFIPFVSLGFPVSWWLLPFVVPQWILGSLYIRFALGIRCLHCRSYHAGLIALIASKFLGMVYVFDPRSPFPEENVSSGRWRLGSINHELWKKIEASIVEGAKKTILVSPCMQNFYHDVKHLERLCVIPNNYPAAFDNSAVRASDELKIEYTFCYVGSFGNWNKPGPYLSLLSALNKLAIEQCNMLFIVRTSAAKEIKLEAERYGVDHSLFDIISVAQDQIPSYLDKCCYGVYLMDSDDPRLGVKTVEYLRAGLPVIVSKNIHGAACLIRSKSLGAVWDHSYSGVCEIHEWMCKTSSLDVPLGEYCRNYARKNHSPSVVARSLIDLYDEVY